MTRRDGKINTWGWRQLRDQVIREEPLCQLQLPGCTHISTTADHIIPRSQAPQLAYARQNLRGSCRSCNDKKSNHPAQHFTRPRALAFFD